MWIERGRELFHQKNSRKSPLNFSRKLLKAQAGVLILKQRSYIETAFFAFPLQLPRALIFIIQTSFLGL
jgi:hypothetical protein